jgi:hypothetical protein
MVSPRVAFLFLSLALVAPAASVAQIPGNLDRPVRPAGTGVRIAAEGAYGLNQDSGEALYTGARVTVELSGVALWVGGGIGGLTAGGDNELAAGVGGAVALVRAPNLTLALDTGFGFTDVYGSTHWQAPVGLTLWLSAPGAGVRPFVGGHGIVAKGGSDTEFGFGGYAGLTLSLGTGVDLYLGAQADKIGDGEPIGIGGGLSVGL